MPKIVAYSLKRFETNNGLGFRVIKTSIAGNFAGQEVAGQMVGTKQGLSAELKAALDKAVAELLAGR